ncbi:uncharacterized protein [Argopecten irradians]|uniref:uncharacterized protein n=1 Tax=Argopecten irradians TaxID=31199 RepID=UPI0037174FCF
MSTHVRAAEEEKQLLSELRDGLKEKLKTLRKVKTNRRNRKERSRKRARFVTGSFQFTSRLFGTIEEAVETTAGSLEERKTGRQLEYCRGVLHTEGRELGEHQPIQDDITSECGREGDSRRTRWTDDEVYAGQQIHGHFGAERRHFGVSKCVEHTNVLTQIIREAREIKGDLAVLWLDLANAYGSTPHQLVELTLDKYHIPEKFRVMLKEYFDNFRMRFNIGSYTTATLDSGDLEDIVTWARMKFKPTKSRSLVLKAGRVKEERFKVVGSDIPTISEKPVQSLGKWFDDSLNDRNSVVEMRRQADEWMKTVDGKALREDDQRTPSTLAWRSPKLKHYIGLYSSGTTLQLPLKSVTEEFKVTKVRQQVIMYVERQRRRQGQGCEGRDMHRTKAERKKIL